MPLCAKVLIIYVQCNATRHARQRYVAFLCLPQRLTDAARPRQARGINANIVQRWIREHARGTLPVSPQEFVALPLQMLVLDAAKPDPVPAKADDDIRIEVRRGARSVTVNWPLQGAASCTAWLRELLR